MTVGADGTNSDDDDGGYGKNGDEDSDIVDDCSDGVADDSNSERDDSDDVNSLS